MVKRVFLFLIVNVLVVLTISITVQLLGLKPYLSAKGIAYGPLLIFCSIMGFGGSFISLAISRWMAKRMMGVQMIDPQRPGSPGEADLVNVVHNLSRQAGLEVMPEVGWYRSGEINAFATGPTEKRALVAVSSGLLDQMDRRELEGVLGHEIAHIKNGDMVTMALLQGVVNTFAFFFARVIGWAIASAIGGRDRERPNFFIQHMIVMVLDVLLTLLGSIVVNAFSRWREFRADAGGAKVAGRDRMIAALEALRRNKLLVDTNQPSLATYKISGKRSGVLGMLFSTHPPLELRIERLMQSV